MEPRIPKPGELWIRKSSQDYDFLMIIRVTNLKADPSRHHEYPPTVHFYENGLHGIMERSMPLSIWDEKTMIVSEPGQCSCFYPYPGSLWKHRKKGTIYFCTGLSSRGRATGFGTDTLVCYRDEQGNEWSKPVEEFMQSMERHNDD